MVAKLIWTLLGLSQALACTVASRPESQEPVVVHACSPQEACSHGRLEGCLVVQWTVALRLPVRPPGVAARTAHRVCCPALAARGLTLPWGGGQAELEERERKHLREKDAGNFEGAPGLKKGQAWLLRSRRLDDLGRRREHGRRIR